MNLSHLKNITCFYCSFTSRATVLHYDIRAHPPVCLCAGQTVLQHLSVQQLHRSILNVAEPVSQMTAFAEFWLFPGRPEGSTKVGRWFLMALVIFRFSQRVSEDAAKKRGRLTNEWGRIARHCGPPRQSGLGCSANSSSARVKDTHSHSCPHAHTLSSLYSSIPGLC